MGREESDLCGLRVLVYLVKQDETSKLRQFRKPLMKIKAVFAISKATAYGLL